MPNLPNSKFIKTVITAVKNPLSYATLALILVASLAYAANEPLLALAILAIYSIVILVLLLRSSKHGKPEQNLSIRYYKNIQALFPDMTRLIEDSVNSERRTSIEVMGLTLYHMWEYTKNFLRDERIKNIDILFTTISGTQQQTNCLKSNWGELSQAFCKSIAEYKKDHLDDLKRRAIDISVHQYGHIPMFHGILINSEHLFFSFTSWSSQGHIEGATTFYSHFNAKDSVGKSFIQVFRNWLNHIQKKHPCEKD